MAASNAVLGSFEVGGLDALQTLVAFVARFAASTAVDAFAVHVTPLEAALDADASHKLVVDSVDVDAGITAVGFRTGTPGLAGPATKLIGAEVVVRVDAVETLGGAAPFTASPAVLALIVFVEELRVVVGTAVTTAPP